MKSLQETLAYMRNDLLKELGLMLQVEAQTTKAEIRINQERVAAKIEVTRHDFQTQLKEEVQARTERGKGTYTGTANPPKFHGTTSLAAFQRQFKTVAEHNCCTRLEKCTYLIILQGRPTNMIYGVPKGATFEETLKTLEALCRNQLLAAAYRSQLKTRIQGVGESLQEFATAIEQLAHLIYPALPEDHVRRKAGKALADKVEDSWRRENGE
jgi:hypothetical protein